MEGKTLAELSQAAMNDFMSGLPEQDQATIGAAFQRLMDSDAGDKAIKEGDTIPAFCLPNAAGKEIKLGELLQQGPVVINFYRGGWCPFCNLEFKALHDYLPEITRHGAKLIGISPEMPDTSLSTIEKHQIQFEVLCDQGNQLAEKLGMVMIVDEAVRPLYEKWGLDIPAANGDDSFKLPIPATYVVSTDGIVRSAYVDKNYTQRMEPLEIVKVLAKLQGDDYE